MLYASFFCGVDYDGLLFLFLHAAFWICGFVRCILLCAFCVVTVGFVSLYVSEFLTFACGVSLLRERPKDSALWNPAALERLANFFLWVRVCWCCSPEHKKQKENHKSSALHKQNTKVPFARTLDYIPNQ